MEPTSDKTIIETSRRILWILVSAGYLIMVFSLGFMWPSFSVYDISIPITDVIFPGVFCLWLIALALKAVRLEWTRFYFVILLFLTACFLSLVFSSVPGRSLVKFAGELYLTGLSVLTLNLVNNDRMARYFLYSWLAAAFFACAVSVLSLILFYADRTNIILGFTLSHYGTLPPGNYPRIASTFLNANMLCNYLNVSIVFLLAAFKLGWINKILFYILLTLAALAVAFTISPGIGGVLLSVGIWYWAYFHDRGQRRIARMSLAIGLAAAAVFFISILFAPTPNALAEYQFEPVQNIRVYSSERVSAWLAAARTFAANPVFGNGLGLESGIASSVGPNGNVHTITDAHEVWLNFAAQTGLVGLSALAVLTIYVVKRFPPINFDLTRGSVFRVGCAAAFIGAFLYQGLGGSYENARHLWVLIGFIAGPMLHSSSSTEYISE
jgi:hypothetical protein